MGLSKGTFCGSSLRQERLTWRIKYYHISYGREFHLEKVLDAQVENRELFIANVSVIRKFCVIPMLLECG